MMKKIVLAAVAAAFAFMPSMASASGLNFGVLSGNLYCKANSTSSGATITGGRACLTGLDGQTSCVDVASAINNSTNRTYTLNGNTVTLPTVNPTSVSSANVPCDLGINMLTSQQLRSLCISAINAGLSVYYPSGLSFNIGASLQVGPTSVTSLSSGNVVYNFTGLCLGELLNTPTTP